MVREAGPLRLKTAGEHDFIMNSNNVWIEIDNIVVYVRRVEGGVAVDLTPTVGPHETLDCCNADFGMAKEAHFSVMDEVTKSGMMVGLGETLAEVDALAAKHGMKLSRE